MATANYSNATLNIPDGGIYRGTNTDLNSPGAIYYRNGNTISSLDLNALGANLYKQQYPNAPDASAGNSAINSYYSQMSSGAAQRAIDYLKTQGIDYNNLTQYNIGDATSAFQGAGFTFNDLTSNPGAFGNLTKSTQAPAGGNLDFTQNTGGATGTQTITTPSGAQVQVPNATAKVPASGSSTMAQYPAQTANQGAVNPGPSASGIPGTPATPTAPTAPTLSPPSTILQPGSADAANVGKLQDYLVSLGLMNQNDLLNGGRGVYGPKTTAAVAALQSSLGVDNSTGVGYFGPKTIAALAGKTSGSTTGSTTTSSAASTGTPEAPNTENGLSPAENVQKIYTDMFAQSGLSDIKSRYEQTLKDQEKLTNDMNAEIANVRNNPWYSQSEADRNAKKIQDKYQSKLETASNFAKLYQSIYEDGVEEIRFRAGLAEHDVQRAFDAAQKRQDALDKLAQQDIQIIDVGGRTVAYDKKSNTIVRDIGPSKIQEGTGTPFGYNGEFAATISLAAQAGSTNVQRQQIQRNLQEFIANRDWASAYTQVISSASAKLTGQNASNFQQQVQQYNSAGPMREALQALQDSGYNTNLLTGSADKIQTKIGVLMTNPKYAAIATRVNAAFQQYRQNMTGAAFGAKESAEYASVLPSAGNTFALNLAKIDGMTQYLSGLVESTVQMTVGQGGNEIKAYAEGAQSAVSSPEYSAADDASVGSIVTIGGVQYRKIGDNEFDPI